MTNVNNTKRANVNNCVLDNSIIYQAHWAYLAHEAGRPASALTVARYPI